MSHKHSSISEHHLHQEHPLAFFHGPKAWALSAAAGVGLGAFWAMLMPTAMLAGAKPDIPLVLVAPFAALLLSIALAPLFAPQWWHRHYPDVALFLGGLVAGYYLRAPWAQGYAGEKLLHAGLEYYAFIALVAGLYMASGAIVIDLKGTPRPIVNTLFLLVGAVLANLIGTTGASMLLIRPFMHANEGRLKPLHVVFFIFIVSNCGGSLTPIGDPPLYLGFIKGVPFLWTFEHLWADWVMVIGALLAVFYGYDALFCDAPAYPVGSVARNTPTRLRARCSALSVVLLLGIVGCVFVDVALEKYFRIHGVPVGATLQLLLGVAAYKATPEAVHTTNDFSLEPVKEVALLFAGIFLAMMPALAYLSQHGATLGIDSPTAYYFATGGLSAVLDNAPTYLNFLQVALVPEEVQRQSLARLLATDKGVRTLDAISTGAVFFGAMTYIGNGPNFMVRSIALRAGVKMPSFLAYAAWACVILLPVLVLHWAIFIR